MFSKKEFAIVFIASSLGVAIYNQVIEKKN
mgnify:CR=1 FL=1